MFKVFIYFLGIILTSLGIFFTLLYTNLLTMGYSLLDFGKFIISKMEFWLIFLGLFLIIIALERWIRHELWLRRDLKLERGSRI